MCVDFTNLNKACLKNAYPLSSIDKLVDEASKAKFLNFMDAYSGYNQIKMHLMDEEKIAFIMKNANDYYKVMSFGLKNTGATYQKLMNRVFTDQIGRIMEVYVDDMVPKTMGDGDHYEDLLQMEVYVEDMVPKTTDQNANDYYKVFFFLY